MCSSPPPPLRATHAFARNADLLFLPLQLIYNRRQLIDLIDKDIKEAGLENAAVNFNFS
jgi:hypothetical protein